MTEGSDTNILGQTKQMIEKLATLENEKKNWTELLHKLKTTEKDLTTLKSSLIQSRGENIDHWYGLILVYGWFPFAIFSTFVVPEEFYTHFCAIMLLFWVSAGIYGLSIDFSKFNTREEVEIRKNVSSLETQIQDTIKQMKTFSGHRKSPSGDTSDFYYWHDRYQEVMENLQLVNGIGKTTAKKLFLAGINTPNQVARSSLKKMQEAGISPNTAASIKRSASTYCGLHSSKKSSYRPRGVPHRRCRGCRRRYPTRMLSGSGECDSCLAARLGE